MKVSIIISSRNEVAMLAVTFRSCIEELKPIVGGGEVVVCDNSDPNFKATIPTVIPSGYIQEKKAQIVYQDFPCLFSAREKAIQQAKGEYIICLDAHVLVGRDMIKDLVDCADSLTGQDKARMGFLHAPINWAHQHERSSKHDRDMNECELGNWGSLKSEFCKISWKGMPWICRREWFMKELGGYGALSANKLAWGGGDMHIGIKPWLLGFENWAVPTSPAIHLGPFPGEVRELARYRTYSESGNHEVCLGFLVSSYVLGGEGMLQRNLPKVEERFKYKFADKLDKVRELGAVERDWLAKRQVMTFDELLVKKPWEGVDDGRNSIYSNG